MANKGMKGLLVWCKNHTEGYKDVNITNMTSSWSNGLGFCALLHRFRPDLIDFESLSKENVLYNNQLAFGIAEKELGIAALLDAEDMAEMAVPDRLSVMTYLSQYYNCFRHCKPEENIPQSDAPVVNPKTTASPAKSTTRRLTDDSICCICGKRVHLVQRYFDEGKLYHRTCHRNDSLEKIRGKNYFVKDKEIALTETNNVEKVKNEAEQKTPATLEGKPVRDISTESGNLNKPNHPQELPNLIESLGGTRGKTINMSITTPSPTVESKTLSSNPDDVAPSLVSELPLPSFSNESNTASVKPKPRTRTLLADAEKDVAPTPVARPRSKDVSDISRESQEDIKPNYNKSLNPFELNSPSDSDTTLSSSSSDDDDSNNPFTRKDVVKDLSNIDNSNAVSDRSAGDIEDESGNPFGDHGCADNDEHESGNPFGDPDENEDGVAETDYGGNPFGDADDEEPVENKVSTGRINPFSKELADDLSKTSVKPRKKRPAPAPPKNPPAIPIAEKKKTSSSHTKAAAPPRPPGWKDVSSQKMAEMNKSNENDPRYAKNTSGTPSLQPRLPKDNVKQKVASPKARSAPGYGYPLVKRKVEIKMSEQEIANELKLLDVQLTDYETKGVKLEEMLRFAMDSDTEWTSEEDELLQEWFQLVNKKNILLREESDLVFQMQQQKLEQEHADIEFQLRKLFNKPESTKTDQDKIDEEKLLQKLLEVVERRNIIINSIEEERLKEAEEDSAYEKMKMLQQNPSKKKKKNKVKKIFSKKGKKDKPQVAKEFQ